MGCGSSKTVSVVPIHVQKDIIPEKRDHEPGDIRTNTTESLKREASVDKTETITSRNVQLSVTDEPQVDNRDEVIEDVPEETGYAGGEEQPALPPEDMTEGQTEVVIGATVSCIDDDAETVVEAEVSYAEFPTHVNLRDANEKYTQKHRGKVLRSSDGSLKPFPSYRRKAELFDAEKFRELDEYADQVNMSHAYYMYFSGTCTCRCTLKTSHFIVLVLFYKKVLRYISDGPRTAS